MWHNKVLKKRDLLRAESVHNFSSSNLLLATQLLCFQGSESKMKGRTHRLQSSDPQDDWVDGSWTVDCVCGVNFDDGEEMVNCDECGVWVHTRCSRYTKGDDSFACDKCKSKSARNDNEEAEVAQLLVELPNSTKTVRMESSVVAHDPQRHSFRLWTEIPMEERVHVQGVPGGDPALFSGLSGIFTRELWKCTGFVPKKFNFRFREFQCWDDDAKKHKKNEVGLGNGNENLADNGAGALFSLSKDRAFDYSVFRRKEVLKEVKQCEDDELVHRRSQSQFGSKKDRDLLHPILVQPVKHKNGFLGVPKDRSSKKKSRTAIQKETDDKKKAQLSSRTGRGAQACDSDVQPFRSKNTKEDARRCTSDSRVGLQDGIQKPGVNLGHSSEASPPDPSGHKLPVRNQLKEEKAYHASPATVKSPPRTVNALGSIMEQKDGCSMSLPVKEESTGTSGAQVHGIVNDSQRSCHDISVKDVAPTVPEIKSPQILENANPGMYQSLTHSDANTKIEVNHAFKDGVFSVDARHAKSSLCNMSTNLMTDVSVRSHSQMHGDKVQIVDQTSRVVMVSFPDKTDELPIEPCPLDKKPEASQNFLIMQNNSSEPIKCAESLVESEAATHQLKDEACTEKSSTALPGSGTTVDNSNHTDTQHSNSSSRQEVISSCNVDIEGSLAENGLARDDDKYTLSQKIVKEQQTSVSKGLHQTRDSNPDPKKLLSDTRDCVPSSKVTSIQNFSFSSGSASVESAEFLQTQRSSHVQQSKGSDHDFMLKAEKFNHSNTHPSKVTNASFSNPYALSNCPAALSDEELALLLHQELNSSPRVPRVPRVRQTGSFPQLASSNAMSMLIKRTSSSGGKDQNLTSRRKHKDASREGFQCSREHDSGSKKIEKLQPSLDHRRPDSENSLDPSKIRENKNLPPVSKTNGGPTSGGANDQNLSSVRNSPNHMSDDDVGTVQALVPHTLPGLINEIMSKGKRMTYDELCNAVLPHWPNLRKHNGERYAYSSHTQAVLDCLRNRHEWAQLVDRGPKTNSTKRRRKVDAEDSENEYSRTKASKEADCRSFESQRDDFPKGKRKARKRRRLALQGRGIKDVQRRRKADFSDAENGPFSNSSGESMYSDDEIEGGEASASSDELGTM